MIRRHFILHTCNDKKRKDTYEMKKFFKNLKKLLAKVGDEITFVLTGKGPVADEMVEAGVLDYSGQGRNEYGK